MNKLLTMMEISDRNLDNSILQGFLKKNDPSHSYVEVDVG